jgi:hypothetical protein
VGLSSTNVTCEDVALLEAKGDAFFDNVAVLRSRPPG